ncbi:uncharacterized protein [Drosophila bipectinata]|uniref:uncharacterized protein n=1 Tax=Drosophila bipectinata TaxID=42026 RepID=UPI001C894FA2|nr:uncharacterized protein LOC108123399 [Drosophila bipectinata]
MTVEEPQIVAISVSHKQQIGYLKDESTWIHCPSCEKFGMSVIQLETVTCLQKFLELTNLCKKWSGRQDINHYCSHCGCYIGRFVSINCSERCISKSARRQAAVDEMTLKQKPKDCAERAQKSREKILAERERKRAQKAAKDLQKTETQIAVHQ